MRWQFFIVLSARDTCRAIQILQVVNSAPNLVPCDFQLCHPFPAENVQELTSQYVGSASQRIIVASFHVSIALGRPSLESPFWDQKCGRNEI